jgi:hypothetical protein
MTEVADRKEALGDFAQVHGLAVEAKPNLPAEGDLLSRQLEVHSACAGSLPGGETGTVAHVSYEYRSDDTTHTVRRTAVILRVPESIGFAPYIGTGAVVGTRTFKLDSGGSVRVAEGVDDAWLRELFSPALCDWVERSPDDLKWELSDGVLCVSRDGFVSGESELTSLCSDAAHLAQAVREESLEEVDSGQASRTAAKRKRDGNARVIRKMLGLVKFDEPPADVAAAQPRFHHVVVRHPSTYLVSLFMTVAITLGVNLIGGGIFGLLLNLSNPGRAVLVFEIIVVLVVGWFVFRTQIRSRTTELAKEAFWVEYARSRGLVDEDPLRFAATHAKAELPGAPIRVMTGSFDGVSGSLMVTGEGFKRGDSIALVAGESGPVASAEFQVSAPGASATVLDAYAAKLSAELRAAKS